MIVVQYQSRRQWHLLPTEGKASVIWWKITDGKRAEEAKKAVVFVEIFVDEKGRTAAEQEKSFTSSLKGYGVVVSRKDYTIDKLNKKI